ncbi:MAG TPA: hypothetical protein PK544_15975 [Spirochaetota bacterium]|nr:hypothetical protein [Spirochaetota bacterium]HPJ37220.1 hypothetical protein [Spirochaetota bacterium]HPQ52193.1 hypothetical protein [Spirochaetota bacterium]
MKKTSVYAILCLLLAIGTGCVSGNFKYPDTMKNQPITAKLYVPDLPLPVVEGGPSGLIAAGIYAATYEPKLNETFNSLDREQVRLNIVNSIQERIPSISKRVHLSVENNAFKGLSIPQNITSEQQRKDNPRLADFNVATVKNTINTPYLFVVRILRWGYHGYRGQSFIETRSTLYDVNKNEIVWRTHNFDKSTYGAFVGHGSITKENSMVNLQKNMKLILDNTIENLQQ